MAKKINSNVRKAKRTSKVLSENALLLREAKKITQALGKMFAPCCEVVLHDLSKPGHSIIAIECPLSGRRTGQSTTEMGLARIKNPSFPEVVQNYANTFPDGRLVKSTSIGIKNSEGKFIAAICLNLDVSLFSSVQKIIENLTACDQSTIPVLETLRSRSAHDVRWTIEDYAAKKNMQARNLSPEQRQEVVSYLAKMGMLQLRGAVNTAAKAMGISRASVYTALK